MLPEGTYLTFDSVIFITLVPARQKSEWQRSLQFPAKKPLDAFCGALQLRACLKTSSVLSFGLD